MNASSAITTRVHAGEKGGIERQHPLRRPFVLAVAEREQARARGAEIDHGEEEGRQCVEAKMRTEPWHAERQRGVKRRRRGEQVRKRGSERNRRYQEAPAVDDARRHFGASDDDGEYAESEQGGDAGKRDRQRHGAGRLSRTPRPPLWLAVLSAMSSMPSVSNALINFISELTLPRTTPSLASIRWMVGNDKPAVSASVR